MKLNLDKCRLLIFGGNTDVSVHIGESMVTESVCINVHLVANKSGGELGAPNRPSSWGSKQSNKSCYFF